MAEIPKQNEGLSQKIPEQGQKLQTLQNIVKYFQSEKVTPSQKEQGIDYVIKLAQIEAKYEEQKTDIKKDVKYFLEVSMQNRLYKHLGEYNINKFDADKDGNIDQKEEQDYASAISEAITKIVLLGGLNKFSQVHYDSDSKSGFSNADKWLAGKVDLGNYILGEKGDKKFAESTLQKLGEISEEELHKMQENKFKPTHKESWKELGLLLAKEFGDGVEDVLRFLGNIPSGILLLSRYLKYRVDINSSDEITKTTGDIKIQELTEENPSLVLLDLLGEKGVELIKKLGEMFASGKQGDIAMMMVTIAGLIAGGAGAAKLGLTLARKSAVKSARIAGREARIAGETTSRTTRNSLKSISGVVGNFARKASRVDDIVGGAGIGHLTGQFGANAEKVKKAQENSGVPYETVIENAKLGDTARLIKAEELIGKISQEQKDIILHIHNHISKGVYQNEFGDLRKMLEELDNSGFSREQSRILMENGILGELKGEPIVTKSGNVEDGEFINGKLSHGVRMSTDFRNKGFYIMKKGEFHTNGVLDGFLKNGEIIYDSKPNLVYNIENTQLVSIVDKKTGISYKGVFTNPTSEYFARELYNGEIIYSDGRKVKVEKGKMIFENTTDIKNKLQSLYPGLIQKGKLKLEEGILTLDKLKVDISHLDFLGEQKLLYAISFYEKFVNRINKIDEQYPRGDKKLLQLIYGRIVDILEGKVSPREPLKAGERYFEDVGDFSEDSLLSRSKSYPNQISYQGDNILYHDLDVLKLSVAFSDFGNEFNRFVKNTGINFGEKLLGSLFEYGGNFDKRYGNGVSAFSRNITRLLKEKKYGEIFGRELTPEDIDKLRTFQTENPYLRDIIKQIQYAYEPIYGFPQYKSYSSGLSLRDKSCKDAETYFGDIVESFGARYFDPNKYRIIGDFIEKNLDKAMNFRTAITTKDIVIDGMLYPKGYLVRLNTDGNHIIGVEPIRMTIFNGGSETLQYGSATFGEQYSQFFERIIPNTGKYSQTNKPDYIDLFLDLLRK